MDFEALYREHAGDVFRFALHLSGRRDLAEDITSETFVRLWTARERDDIASVKGYLLAIARNLHLQALRTRWREVPEDQAPEPQAQDDPEREAGRRGELGAVMKALAELPEVDRAALLLRAEEGLPYEEIAALLGTSVTAAKVKVHRARQRLLRLGPALAGLTRGGAARGSTS